VREWLANGGVTVVTGKSPGDFHDYMKKETARWGKVVKQVGVTVD